MWANIKKGYPSWFRENGNYKEKRQVMKTEWACVRFSMQAKKGGNSTDLRERRAEFASQSTCWRSDIVYKEGHKGGRTRNHLQADWLGSWIGQVELSMRMCNEWCWGFEFDMFWSCPDVVVFPLGDADGGGFSQSVGHGGAECWAELAARLRVRRRARLTKT
jgi:hypothetical protein